MIGPNQKKWLDALRSGQYEQGKSWLCRNGKYCCLGVACEVFELPKEIVGDRVKYAGSTGPAPCQVVDALGLHSDTGWTVDGGDSVVTLNDRARKTFAEIADILEANADSYFVGPR